MLLREFLELWEQGILLIGLPALSFHLGGLLQAGHHAVLVPREAGEPGGGVQRLDEPWGEEGFPNLVLPHPGPGESGRVERRGLDHTVLELELHGDIVRVEVLLAEVHVEAAQPVEHLPWLGL
jgi:hypothetical protein